MVLIIQLQLSFPPLLLFHSHFWAVIGQSAIKTTKQYCCFEFALCYHTHAPLLQSLIASYSSKLFSHQSFGEGKDIKHTFKLV